MAIQMDYHGFLSLNSDYSKPDIQKIEAFPNKSGQLKQATRQDNLKCCCIPNKLASENFKISQALLA